MKIERADIVRAIDDAAYFARGFSYFSDRKVLSVKTGRANHVSGEVSGSGGRLYRVEAQLHLDADGRLSSVDGQCSCPIGFNCKHVVAVLLEAAQRMGAATLRSTEQAARQPDPAQPQLPGDVQVWLSKLSAPQGTPGPAKVAEISGDQIIYVFRCNRAGRPEIAPFKAYVKKDGTIGKNVSEYHRNHVTYPPANATVQDAVIVAQLGFFSTRSYPPEYNWPDGEALSTFLRQIVATGRTRAGDSGGRALCWAAPRQIAFQWEPDEKGDQSLSARDSEGRVLELLPFPDLVFVDEAAGEIGFAETGLPAQTAALLAAAPSVPAEAARAVADALAGRGGLMPVPRAMPVMERSDLAPSAVLTLFGHERLLRAQSWAHSRRGQVSPPQKAIYPCARLGVQYDDNKDLLTPGNGADLRRTAENGLTIIRRDFKAEVALLDRLKQVAKTFAGYHPDLVDFHGTTPKAVQEAHVVFQPVSPEENSFDSPAFGFMAKALPELRELGWKIEIEPSWPFHLYDGDVAFQTVFAPTGNDWFSLGLKLEVDGTAMDLTPAILQIVRSLPVGETGDLAADFDLAAFLSGMVLYPQLSDGRFVPLAGQRLTGFVQAFFEAHGITGFHKAEVGRATTLAEALDGCGAPWDGGAEIRALGKRLRNLSEVTQADVPAQLNAELRPYQRVGYGWLKALSECGFGGILADDMGLGKTVQALALLAHRHLENKSDRPSLLLVPTSLISNWQTEAARFTPDLKLLTLYGADRHKRFHEIGDHHLVMTTYPLVIRDHVALFDRDYDLAILDEAQAVKNPAATVAKRIREIKARQRLALTGTPLQNNLTELWSLYDWLIPGLLGDRKRFASDYRKPIEQQGDRAVQRLLSARVKPFLLRRTKDEVAADLPAKTVIDEMVTLSGRQAALYESVRTAMDARVREAIAAKGLAGSRITVLDALLKLRQVCCDPRLLKLDAAAHITDSAKRDRLMEILVELISEGRRVLIFSQFVEMLRLIEAEVQARGWPYAMLHGKTADRGAEVARFQSGKVPIFLISLKAGGTGLNLTAADTVILYDPWWNPAVERQAMDRAHRIGQDKPVFVHRLFAADTVETAIHAMQAQKQALADALFEGTGGGPLTLTEDDLAGLFGSA